MKTTAFPQLLALAIAVSGCASSPTTGPGPTPAPATHEGTTTVVLASEVEWQQLNPARGDASPRAATLWGDRNGRAATGFLVRFIDGFESPPHIHNVTYRGVVVRGLVHNDDPNAEPMWMPTGAFWTQPKGAVHITAARGDTIAFIEIDEGPYLVRPVDQAFSSDEKPINVDPTNLVWLNAETMTRGPAPGAPAAANGPKIAFLWGRPHDGGPGGMLVKLPVAASAEIRSHGTAFRAVVIQGRPSMRVTGRPATTSMDPGSSIRSDASPRLSCDADGPCVLYVRAEGRIDVVPAVAKDE